MTFVKQHSAQLILGNLVTASASLIVIRTSVSQASGLLLETPVQSGECIWPWGENRAAYSREQDEKAQWAGGKEKGQIRRRWRERDLDRPGWPSCICDKEGRLHF